MRYLFVAALLAAPHLAAADDLGRLRTAARSPRALADMLADQVQVELAIETPSCGKLTGTVEHDKVAPCLNALGGTTGFFVRDGIGSKDPVVTSTWPNLSLTVVLRGGKITAIGPVAPNRADVKLPTTVGLLRVDFAPSKSLAATLDKRPDEVTVVHKVCFDETGVVKSRRLVEKSRSAAFDKETTAWVAALKPLGRPLKPFGTAIAFCDLVTMVYPENHNGEEGGVEGGEEGGVVGGVVGGDINGYSGAPPPPPPPPPPAPPQNVPPTLLEGLRIAGEKNIAPDDRTKTDMVKAKKEKVIASFKMCLDRGGQVILVSLLKSSGFPDYDAKLRAGMRTWAYRPYEVNGHAVPVCTAITFIYSQAAPPPPAP